MNPEVWKGLVRAALAAGSSGSGRYRGPMSARASWHPREERLAVVDSQDTIMVFDFGG